MAADTNETPEADGPVADGGITWTTTLTTNAPTTTWEPAQPMEITIDWGNNNATNAAVAPEAETPEPEPPQALTKEETEEQPAETEEKTPPANPFPSSSELTDKLGFVMPDDNAGINPSALQSALDVAYQWENPELRDITKISPGLDRKISINPSTNEVESSTKVGSVSTTETKDLDSFGLNILSRGYVNTGLMPTGGEGVVSIRSVAGMTQVVYVRPPGVYNVIWGRRERDANAQTYPLATPYQIIILDIVNSGGNHGIHGVRQFWSEKYPHALDIELLAPPLPNHNILGYNGTSVGWVCTYARKAEVSQDNLVVGLNDAIRLGLDMASGSEAYNDGNMGSIDGPAFYMQHYIGAGKYDRMSFSPPHAEDYKWNPAKNTEKTKKEGPDWAAEPGVWLPLLVRGLDRQFYYCPDGVPLTLEMAMYGHYSSNYSDAMAPIEQTKGRLEHPQGNHDFRTTHEYAQLSKLANNNRIASIVAQPKAFNLLDRAILTPLSIGSNTESISRPVGSLRTSAAKARAAGGKNTKILRLTSVYPEAAHKVVNQVVSSIFHAAWRESVGKANEKVLSSTSQGQGLVGRFTKGVGTVFGFIPAKEVKRKISRGRVRLFGSKITTTEGNND